MLRKSSVIAVVVLATCILATAKDDAEQPRPAVNGQSATMPLSTKSAEARRLMEEAWRLNLDLVEQEEACVVLRKVVKIDPDFAFAHELLSQISLDPAEQLSEQEKALSLRTDASAPEREIIEWWQDSMDHKLIPAITKMNDVLAQYPHDKWVVFLTTWWLTNQTQWERSNVVFEHSGLTDSPGLMNNAAYNYAYLRQFDKAFDLMDKYVAALPNDSNPQDSYAEILRMAGKFDKSIEHYRMSLEINPEFYASAFGMGDTYSLMGDQVKAREEYKADFQKFPSLPELHVVQWRTREATTFVRDGDFAAADAAFQAIADYAHSKHLSQVEADTYRQMAMYQPDPKRAFNLLDKAETAIKEGKNSMHSMIQQEQAQVLRVRVQTAIKTNNRGMASLAVKRLTELADASDDRIIDTAYQGATGAFAFSEHKYDEAISHLEEDSANPLSLKLLASAYQKIGYSAGMKRTDDILTNFNDPTLEQALVVPAFRKCYSDPSCTNGEARVEGVRMKH